MALALNNLKRVDMPLNKETNQTKPDWLVGWLGFKKDWVSIVRNSHFKPNNCEWIISNRKEYLKQFNCMQIIFI